MTTDDKHYSNFDFLKEHDSIFFEQTYRAEQTFSRDPNTTLIKLRQFGEALAQDLAARCGLTQEFKTTQAKLLNKLSREINLDRKVIDVFHKLRIAGNRTTHEFKT